MITIGICDEDLDFSKNLCNIIERVMFPLGDWTSRIFSTAAEVIEAIKSGVFDCQLLFIDIMMNDGAGFEVAKYICQNNPDTDLIFVTTSAEHVFECYHYHAFAYLLKPISEKAITSELQRYLNTLQFSPKHLTISFQGITHQIPLNTILYIESNLRKITIHTQETCFYCYQKLNDIAEILKNDGFVRCHQSYLIALDKVTSYTNTQLYIQDARIPISNRYQTKLKELFSHPSVATTRQKQTVLSSLNQTQKNYGALICVHGAYLGSIIRIKPEQKILIGRDGNIVDMIINLPFVSRIHCTILYHCDTMEYEIVDLSHNGTFVNGNKRLLRDETYLLKPGNEICFGDKETIYKLG